ncbi:cytochrome P450 [Luedemannella helvata]|uniref:Cytochrome P450 n=1 Tax=Luedemannella helvata TaxID=349315 RepID=A0ABP4X3N8_9ACTN
MASLVRFDTDDPALIDDPYRAYARLRAAGPVARGGPGQWVFSHYAEVSALLRDERLGSEFPQAVHRLKLGDGPACDFFTRILIDRDPPGHTRLRQAMSRSFTPSAVRDLRDRVAGIVDDLIGRALDRGGFDLVGDLALPLPVTVVCSLLGVPADDLELVRPRMVDLATGFGELTLTQEQRVAADGAVEWLRAYIGEHLDHRRRHPTSDQLSLMLEAESAGVSRADLVDNAIFLFFAGFETTTSLVVNGTMALLDHPDQLARLRAEPEMATHAVEELLRFDPPVQMSMRLVHAPLVVDGVTIRAGRVAVLLIGSANRDERQFPDPDRLDIGRRPNPHLAFGGGHHYCLGAPLARIEGALVLDRLVRRCRSLELAGPPVRRPHASIRSYRSVPVTVTAA